MLINLAKVGVSWDGKLYRNDIEITEEQIKSWIEANTKQIVIEQVISDDYFEQYKSEFDKRGGERDL